MGVVYEEGSTDIVTPGSTVLPEVPKKNGYTFKGFYSEPQGEGMQLITADGVLTERVVELKAQGEQTWNAFWSSRTSTPSPI